MFKIKFNDSAANATMTAEFDSYLDLVYFVADKKIQDEDFVSINFGEDDIVGIDGLCSYTKDVVTAAKEAAAAAAAAEEEYFEDEESEEENEEERAFSEVFGDLESIVY